MREKSALILFATGGMLLQILVVGGLHGLGAGSETIASTVALEFCALGLGWGWLFMRYH
jgi:hypothetical protein